MNFRPAPGAVQKRVKLGFLPADHAHYRVVVGPGRSMLTFVLTAREAIDAGTEMVWMVDGRGRLVKKWTAAELGVDVSTLRRTAGHVWWRR